MSNIEPLIQPIDREKVIAELDAITGPDTTGICIIASTPDGIAVRTWGDQINDDVRAAASVLAQEAGDEHNTQGN